MFYLSRAEQAALLVLGLLLLLGTGVLTYAKGQHSVSAGAAEPVFVPALGKTSDNEVLVEMAGAVAKPGLYRLPPGSRLREAVAQAGGLTAEADTDAINLAARVRDGDKIVIPVVSQVSPKGRNVSPVVLSSRPISLNKATTKELETLPGIGPVYAERIVAFRQQKIQQEGHGFQSVDELLNVPGIGPKRFAAIRELVTL